MRRPVLILAVLSALAAPVAALAAPNATGDGTLVVKNGQAPPDTPVVALVITGSVIGQVDHGSVVIDPGVNNGGDWSVTGYEWTRDSIISNTAQRWGGASFKFRAVGGKFTVLVYGTGVNVVAVGKGTVKLAGTPDTPHGDGTYSLNGNDPISLPGTQTDKISLTSNG